MMSCGAVKRIFRRLELFRVSGNAAAFSRFFCCCADPVSNPVEQLCNQIQAGLLLSLLLPLLSLFLLIFLLLSLRRLCFLLIIHFPSPVFSFLFSSFYLLSRAVSFYPPAHSSLPSPLLISPFSPQVFLLSLSLFLASPPPSLPLFLFDAATGKHLATC